MIGRLTGHRLVRYTDIMSTMQEHAEQWAEVAADDEQAEEERPELDNDVGRRLLKNRTVLLTGEIDTKLSTQIVGQLLYLEAESREPIKVMIDSPGGDVNAGFAIFDTLRFVQPTIYTVGIGLVASAGAIILLAAKRENRFGLANSHYMIHQPMSGMSGVASDIEIHAREIERIHHQINSIIAKECKKTVAQVEKDTDRDFWLNAKEAVVYGLIDSVIRSSTELKKRIK